MGEERVLNDLVQSVVLKFGEKMMGNNDEK